MRWSVAWLIGLTLLASSGGCRSCDRVESELRARENDVRELREELEKSELYNQALQQELHHLRPGWAGGHPPHTAVVAVRSLALGRGTGGISNDRCPGDDALEVLLEPRDPDGTTIKVPGTVQVEAIEIDKEGLKHPFSAWEIPPDQLRRSWTSGLLTTGYKLILPWKAWPNNNKVRVVARLRLPDGRLFEAEKEVRVHVVPVEQRRPLAPDVFEGPPPSKIVPGPQPVLPEPRPDTGPILPMPSGGPKPLQSTAPDSLWQPVDPLPAAEIMQPVPGK